MTNRHVPACAPQGAYRDDAGKPVVLDVVREAEERIAGSNTMEYLPIGGLKAFNDLSVRLAYGDDAAAVREGRVAAVQSLSGTGARAFCITKILSWRLSHVAMHVYGTLLPCILMHVGKELGVGVRPGRGRVAEQLCYDMSRLMPADGGVHGALHAGRAHPDPQAHMVQPPQVRASCSFPP